jgi:hypothetical protein
MWRKGSIVAVFFLAAALVLGNSGPARLHAAEPPALEEALFRQAPKVIARLQERGYANIGVLKFLVTKDDRAFNDNVGTLNQSLARRLELALLLVNDPRRPVGIVANASAVAQRTPGANHLTRAGRDKLFAARYPLAWGRQEVSPDAFLTGTAAVSKDLRTLTVSLLAFDRKNNKLEQLLDDFTASNLPSRLSEMGESFVLRGGADGGEVKLVPEQQRQEQSLQQAARVREQKATHPAVDRAAPVTLEVRYDGRPVAYEVRDGRALIPEPREGQQVEMVLRRDGGKERYGCVLKVNGENTLYRQKVPDLECLRWVLDPGDGPIRIRGYQSDGKTVAKFRVLSVAESKERAINYGDDVGTITLTVFRELREETKAPDLSEDVAEVAAVGRAELPQKQSANYHALKARLLQDANRGLLGEGEKESGTVRHVEFTPDPIPVMSLTIVYYRP